ncbi:hypothetical protein [Bacillus methanolicus]|uniref:Uncharacterized protein n=1 Tax=Bacillus methanolicus (strain MGA3 / ATCC 53907) TaxID=796606 RepID=I3E7D3_BACMM|nr:hypothetical protein [Bacillus methanolicus]AIE59232.1 hypothetical protein BMMGA3_03960 [Bacillus methanolicus MGA3]EIJ82404.1 hypothetical protein MGA3_04140 [Bacillus methanolicus MGA3]UQD51304.1 hypothetical protein C0971_04200 [Bacillus methanolicus]
MKKHGHNFLDDILYEGRDSVHLDVDRMINEGMAGGQVHRLNTTPNIEEARDLVQESPPHETK